MSDDILGIYWWIGKDGKTHYRARGIGEKYKKLYEWLKTSSYQCTSEDWPWDYFIFTNKEDEKKIAEMFPDDVMEDLYP